MSRGSKDILIESAIKVIARDGLDKATTKAISKEANLNEVYIYRYFKDKEDLLVNVFNCLDEELVGVIEDQMPVFRMFSIDLGTRFRIAFNKCWRFMLANEERLRSYVTYYYSVYMQKNSLEEHLKRYGNIINRLTPYFCDNCNVAMVLKHLLNSMLDFALSVHNGILTDCADTEEHVFRVVFSAVRSYVEENKSNKEE